ncbi:MAG: DUF4913 domain-containing protein [Acidimicrobiales bacterium]
MTTALSNPVGREEEPLEGPAPAAGSSACATELTVTEAPKPRFANVVGFVERYLAPVATTRLGGAAVWCPYWWEHPGAVLRLEALWRSWEALRLQPGGMSTWWTGHYDPHMRVLLDADRGPFYRCQKAHTPAVALSTVPPPPGWPKPAAAPSKGA